MAYTQAQIDELKKTLASGVASATGPDGRSVTRWDIEKLEKQLSRMENEVNGTARPRRTVAAFDGGF